MEPVLNLVLILLGGIGAMYFYYRILRILEALCTYLEARAALLKAQARQIEHTMPRIVKDNGAQV